VTEGRRKLHNEVLRSLYSSPSIIRMIKSWIMRHEGHVARMGDKGTEYGILVGTLEGKRPIGRARRKWEVNIAVRSTVALQRSRKETCVGPGVDSASNRNEYQESS
jgi:hypothetical protein